MRPDGVWRRIRWGNVARLIALIALALVVAVWPRLGDDPPRLPPADPVPLAGALSEGRESGAERARGEAKGGEGERLGGGERGGWNGDVEVARGSQGKRGRSERREGEGEWARPERQRGGGKRRRDRERRGGEEERGGDGAQDVPVARSAPVVRRSAPVDPAAVEFGVP